jgi:citrate lyase subunit beta/citryl-CoA lyase
MPGANERALVKAASLPTDVVVLDLEDAVAPAAKESARTRVCEAVRERRFGAREVVVRINGLDTPWGDEDLRAVASAGPDAVLAPKVGSAAALVALDEALEAAGASDALALWAMIETPAAVLDCAAICATAGRTRLAALVAGTNDLARDMRIPQAPHRRALQFALSTIVTAARAHGLLAIDGVYNAIDDAAGLEAECEEGRLLGFDGKSLIHPSQLETANRVFAPDEAALCRARETIEAYEVAQREGRGVIEVDGRLVEALHVEEARRLLAVDEAIRRRV